MTSSWPRKPLVQWAAQLECYGGGRYQPQHHVGVQPPKPCLVSGLVRGSALRGQHAGGDRRAAICMGLFRGCLAQVPPVSPCALLPCLQRRCALVELSPAEEAQLRELSAAVPKSAVNAHPKAQGSLLGKRSRMSAFR